MNEELKMKIISAAYGDAGIRDRISVWLLTKKDPECRRLYAAYKKTAGSVHSIKLDECPDEVINNIFNKLESDKRKSINSGISYLYGKPVFAAVTAAVILTLAIVIFNLRQQPQPQNYSHQEVVYAEQQVKESLALVSRILNKTSKRVEQDILPNKVSKPIKQGFEIINQLFPKGVKPDENS